MTQTFIKLYKLTEKLKDKVLVAYAMIEVDAFKQIRNNVQLVNIYKLKLSKIVLFFLSKNLFSKWHKWNSTEDDYGSVCGLDKK